MCINATTFEVALDLLSPGFIALMFGSGYHDYAALLPIEPLSILMCLGAICGPRVFFGKDAMPAARRQGSRWTRGTLGG